MRSSILIALATAALVTAHTVISYPGWRGNNLITNETFPYGMQWMYPCGGMHTTKNRTYWPTSGGTIAFQPGWFRGHYIANLQVNLGFGTDGPDGGPPNMSFPMVKPFAIQGPTNNPYPGTICLTQVPLPVNATVKPGDKATIQVVEQAQHGAALYSCVDIVFVEPGDSRLAPINETNCYNSTQIGFADIYTIVTKQSTAVTVQSAVKSAAAALTAHVFGWVPMVAAGLWILF